MKAAYRKVKANMKQQMKITKHAPVAEYRQIRKYVVDTVWESGNAPKRLASMRELPVYKLVRYLVFYRNEIANYRNLMLRGTR